MGAVNRYLASLAGLQGVFRPMRFNIRILLEEHVWNTTSYYQSSLMQVPFGNWYYTKRPWKPSVLHSLGGKMVFFGNYDG